jgi:hypothetical protein
LTFTGAAKGFDSITYTQDKITATRAYKLKGFITVGSILDSAKTQHDEELEFGSTMQWCTRLGEANFSPYQPYAIPFNVNISEMTTPPFGAAAWSFKAPFRSMKALLEFPKYAYVDKFVIDFAAKPSYELRQSMVMVTASGGVFSKPN